VKIRTKMIIAFVSIALVPMLLATSVVISNLRKQAVENFYTASSGEMTQVENAIRIYFQAIEQNVEYIASHPLLMRADSSLTTYMATQRETAMASQTNRALEGDIWRYFEHFGETHQGHAYVYLGTTEGAYIQWPAGSVSAGYDPRTRPWYQTAMSTPGRPVRTAAYYWEPDDATIISTVMTTSNALGRAGGVVGLDVSLNELTELVREIRLGETGYLMLLEGDGNILVDAKKPQNNFKQLSELSDDYRQLANARVQEVSLDGTTYMVNTITSAALGWRMIGLIERSEVMKAANQMTVALIILVLIIAAGMAAVGRWVAMKFTQPMNEISSRLQEIAEGKGDLTQRLPVSGNDELGELAGWFNKFLESIRELVVRIQQVSERVSAASTSATGQAKEMSQISERQTEAVNMVSTAFHEMAATSSEVSKSCTSAAGAADTGFENAEAGQRSVDASVQEVEQLQSEVSQSVEVISLLSEDSQNIQVITSTISAIAEQTNLLALNAAIESARAGEQGRGFAVVADEVRALAQRTAESTEQIRKLLNTLTHRTETAKQSMEGSKAAMEATVESIEKVRVSFDQVRAAVNEIRDMNNQIATAAEEQHQVAEDINERIIAVNDDAADVSSIAVKVKAGSESLGALATELEKLVSSFRT